MSVKYFIISITFIGSKPSKTRVIAMGNSMTSIDGNKQSIKMSSAMGQVIIKNRLVSVTTSNKLDNIIVNGVVKKGHNIEYDFKQRGIRSTDNLIVCSMHFVQVYLDSDTLIINGDPDPTITRKRIPSCNCIQCMCNGIDIGPFILFALAILFIAQYTK